MGGGGGECGTARTKISAVVGGGRLYIPRSCSSGGKSKGEWESGKEERKELCSYGIIHLASYFS